MIGDEGRGVAAIRFGEVPSNLRSGDVRMRKLSRQKRLLSLARVKCTQGSETSQYLEEKRLISISLVAASESEKAQTELCFYSPAQRDCKSAFAGYKAVICAQDSTKKLQIVR